MPNPLGQGFTARRPKIGRSMSYLASIPVVPSRPSIEDYFDRLGLVERRVTLVARLPSRLSSSATTINIFVPFDLIESRPDSVFTGCGAMTVVGIGIGGRATAVMPSRLARSGAMPTKVSRFTHRTMP